MGMRGWAWEAGGTDSQVPTICLRTEPQLQRGVLGAQASKPDLPLNCCAAFSLDSLCLSFLICIMGIVVLMRWSEHTSCNLQHHLRSGGPFLFHFKDQEGEAQRRQATCPGSHSEESALGAPALNRVCPYMSLRFLVSAMASWLQPS